MGISLANNHYVFIKNFMTAHKVTVVICAAIGLLCIFLLGIHKKLVKRYPTNIILFFTFVITQGYAISYLLLNED